MKTYFCDNGLLVSGGMVCGYIFNFGDHGAFAAGEKVQLRNGVVRDLTPEEIDTHNRLLGEAEIAGLDKCEVGQWGTLYYSIGKGVTTWTGLVVSNQVHITLGGKGITFIRNGRKYRGKLQKDADCFNFKRIS